MATQYTPILQLALPVTGELNGTWGDVVNDNITSMVEEAIAGKATISTWTANAHTLTTVDGLTDEARCAMIVAQTGAGGTALTAAGEIICPARTKLYVVSNQSAYQVTIKTAAGTGIAIAAGDTTFVFCDGTNVLACVTQITNGHVTGNLTVDGNTTLGNATSDTITATARFASDVNPSADNTYDLGTAGNSWRNLYIDGTATIATLNVTTIDTTNLEVTNIKAKDGTAAITIADATGAVTIATDLAANGNTTIGNATSDTLTVTARVASNVLPSADNTYDLGSSGNSWKDIYADGSVNATTVDATNIEVTNLKAKDGTAAGSIADTTGVVTLNSAILTTADINGGTVDNATIGATTPTTGRFTQVDITAQGDLRLQDTTGGEYVALQAPGTLASSYTLTLPVDDGTSGQALITDGSGNLSWSTAASGDVYGPASATDTAVALFDGITGKLIKNSVVTIDGSGNVSGLGTVNATTLDLTNLEVTNIKAKDGTAAITLAGSTGVATFTANPILNAATANGVAYLNGSKVLTTGSALTWNGSFLSVNGGIGAVNGNHIYSYNSDNTNYVVVSNVGATGATNGQLVWTIGNVGEQMRLTSTGLGIGTSSSYGFKTAVRGTISSISSTFNNSNAGGCISMFCDNANYGTIWAQKNGNSAWGDIAIAPSGGNVGIGTSSPNYLLSVQANSVQMGMSPQSGIGYLGNYSNAPIGFVVNNAEKMRLDASGNLGLGVTPSAWNSAIKAIQLGNTGAGIWSYTSSATSDEHAYFVNNSYLNSSAQQTYVRDGGAAQYRLVDGTHAWFTAPSGTAGNPITFTQAMTLDASGNLLVGTTSNSPSGKFNIAGNITPQTTNTYTLGTSSYVWSNVYATALTEATYPVVSQADIGTAPNEVPVNGMLGDLAFQNKTGFVTTPAASAVPAGIGDMVFQLTNNTTLVVKVKGSDGTVRSATLTLA